MLDDATKKRRRKKKRPAGLTRALGASRMEGSQMRWVHSESGLQSGEIKGRGMIHILPIITKKTIEQSLQNTQNEVSFNTSRSHQKACSCRENSQVCCHHTYKFGSENYGDEFSPTGTRLLYHTVSMAVLRVVFFVAVPRCDPRALVSPFLQMICIPYEYVIVPGTI